MEADKFMIVLITRLTLISTVFMASAAKGRDLSPLELERSQKNSWTEESEHQRLVTNGAERSASQETNQIRRSPISEIIWGLSRLESPQLRELGRRLGTLFNVVTPRCHQKFKHPYAHLHVGDRWERLQGCNAWKGLLDPFDETLKAEILRYGEFAQATYDAFDRNRQIPEFRGTSKFKKDELLEKVGLGNRGYEIRKFLYATTNFQPPKLPKACTYTNYNDLVEPLSKQSSWIGFVAVCTSREEIARLGRRDILIAWRGTITSFEWVANLMDFILPSGRGPNHEVFPDLRVETGFMTIYTSMNKRSLNNKVSSARDQVLEAVKNLVEEYKHEAGKLSITVTGHSLGAALATLCAYDIAENRFNVLSDSPKVPLTWNSEESVASCGAVRRSISGLKNNLERYLSVNNANVVKDENGTLRDSNNDRHVKRFPAGKIPITVFTFAGPRVGNRAFQERMQDLGVAVLRVANKRDVVVLLPGCIDVMSYKHVGVKLEIDSEKSDYLKKPANMSDLIRHPHNLEAYLHLVDAYHGPREKLYTKTFRDHALVNKHADLLVPEYNYIPPCWWQEENKGLVRDHSGGWRFPKRDDDEGPTTPTLDEPVPWINNYIAQRRYREAMHENFQTSHGDDDRDRSFLGRVDQAVSTHTVSTPTLTEQ